MPKETKLRPSWQTFSPPRNVGSFLLYTFVFTSVVVSDVAFHMLPSTWMIGHKELKVHQDCGQNWKVITITRAIFFLPPDNQISSHLSGLVRSSLVPSSGKVAPRAVVIVELFR